MQKGERNSSPFFAIFALSRSEQPLVRFAQQRLAPRERCVQLCFAFKPGGVIRPPGAFELTPRLYSPVLRAASEILL